MRLCVLYQDMYGGKKKKEEFSDHIHTMFLTEEGVKLFTCNYVRLQMMDKVNVQPNATIYGWINIQEIEVAAQEQ